MKVMVAALAVFGLLLPQQGAHGAVLQAAGRRCSAVGVLADLAGTWIWDQWRITFYPDGVVNIIGRPGGSVKLTTDGQLQLALDDGQTTWSCKTDQTPLSSIMELNWSSTSSETGGLKWTRTLTQQLIDDATEKKVNSE